MRPRLIPLLLALAAAPFCVAAEAQSTTAATANTQEAPASETQALSKTGTTGSHIEVSGPTSRVSNRLASAITTTLPKYEPPPPPVANTNKDPALEEAEEIDDPEHPSADGQPRNKIIRLPKMVVEANRSPVFRDRDINTKKGLAKLASKKYISTFDKSVLNRFTIPIFGISPEQRALMMYEEQERLDNIDDLKSDARNAAKAGDSAEAKAIMRETNKAYIRSGGMDWTLPKD